MSHLKISEQVSLPVDIVTQTIAILAKRRAGKSYTMRRVSEQLLRKKQQIVIVDPKGDQWGIRSSADGKKAGFPVVIIGGEHGDVPLEVSAGEVVAKLVVEERVSILLDLSQLRKHEIATFMAIFLETLYRMKAKEEYRTPVMLVVDEADAIAPQKPQKGEERMLGAIEDIVRRGGQRGVGCTLVTQRSAVLNKNVLTQAQMLVVLRTIAPQDLAAMKAWIDVHGTPEQGKELMDSLPSLPIGDAWFWSPGWPTEEGIFQRSHVLPIETFDSGATPKPGERKVAPKTAADVDLKALQKQMAATIEKAKADDPKELRRKIGDLEKQLSMKNNPVVNQGIDQKEVDRLMKEFEKKKDIEFMAERDEFLKHIKTMFTVLQTVGVMVKDIKMPDMKARAEKTAEYKSMLKIEPRPSLSSKAERSEPIVSPVPTGEEGPMLSGERIILAAIAQQGDKGSTRPAITAITGYKKTTRNRYIQYLQQKGFVRAEGGDRVFVTQEGINVLGPSFEALPTGADLREHLLKTLPEGERKIMAVLFDAYPSALDREQITELTGYQKSTRNRYLQYLAAKELIEYPDKIQIRAADELYGS